MKIAIYGDSYADGEQYNEHTWASQLAQRMGADHIDYLAVKGSPFYHCYRTVLASADQYDRIIVSVTEPNRFPVQVESQWVYNISAADQLSGQNRRNQFQWYASVDPVYLHTVQELMIADLQRRYSNLVLVPSFHASYTGQRRSQYGDFSLMALREYCLRTLGLPTHGFIEERTEYGSTLCHLPWTWHSALADLLYNNIVHGVRLDIHSVSWPALDSAEHYYNLRR